jgi:hypothetical protein
LLLSLTRTYERLAGPEHKELQVEEDFRIKPSVLADLGPLPDVVETNSETVWDTFVTLVAQPSRPVGRLSVDAVLAQARRFNRICPVEAEWLRLQAVLTECGGCDAPPAMHGAAFRRAPPLARRSAVREQVEWAAARGCLLQVYAFLEALPEDRWVHMDDV